MPTLSSPDARSPPRSATYRSAPLRSRSVSWSRPAIRASISASSSKSFSCRRTMAPRSKLPLSRLAKYFMHRLSAATHAMTLVASTSPSAFSLVDSAPKISSTSLPTSLDGGGYGFRNSRASPWQAVSRAMWSSIRLRRRSRSRSCRSNRKRILVVWSAMQLSTRAPNTSATMAVRPAPDSPPPSSPSSSSSLRWKYLVKHLCAASLDLRGNATRKSA
mmetsp:Transcript_6396/g.14738  ORF Transcript_6396/g.14738 Transcript_6396/m.14738 type:complete len:218 (-) Transcript_6396:273-926(-)